jgi:small-conductance mechanosensitive channel
MAITSLNTANQLIFVMVKTGVYFAVRTEFLNIIWKRFGLQRVKYGIWEQENMQREM